MTLNSNGAKFRFLRFGVSSRGGSIFIESIIAMGIVSLLLLAAFAAVALNRLQAAKSNDLDTMIDFGHHYMEVIRALPYERISSNYPLNTIYDGSVSVLAPDGTTKVISVCIPSSDAWNSLNTTSMQVFHPDLVFLSGRSPEYRVKIDKQTTKDGDRAKQITLSMRWDPPLGRGAKQTLNMTIVVYPEFQ